MTDSAEDDDLKAQIPEPTGRGNSARTGQNLPIPGETNKAHPSSLSLPLPPPPEPPREPGSRQQKAASDSPLLQSSQPSSEYKDSSDHKETIHKETITSLVSQTIATISTNPESSINGTVAAVITVEDDHRFLPQTLEAILGQTVLPANILIADCSHDHSSRSNSQQIRVEKAGDQVQTEEKKPGEKEEKSVTVWVIPVKARSFTAAVNGALNSAREDGIISNRVSSLAVFHDDSRPLDERYLELLLEARRNNPHATVIGTKQMDWEASSLHNVGYYAAPGHRIASLVVDGEEDQEQYDSRGDVFAVSLSGALIDTQEWLSISDGTYSFSTFGQSRDFCRRVCLSGGRVIVVPQARTGHRRARLEGVRTAKGQAVQDGVKNPIPSYGAQVMARDTYYYSDIPVVRWLPSWILRFLLSLFLFARLLGRKQVYQAGVELSAPWRNLGHLFTMISARMRVTSQSTISMRKLPLLTVTRQQVSAWKERVKAADNQENKALVSTLAKAHLRSRMAVRYGWALVMVLLAFALGLAVNINLLRPALTGSVLQSASLIPSGASWSQLFQAATTNWSYGAGLGLHAAPAPFLLVLVLLSVLTAGHVAYVPTIVIFLSAPCAALAFWALAGIATRSNAVRVTSSLAWVGLGILSGFYTNGNLPMLILTVFLPAGLAFTFKALGMYRTEEPEVPVPSAQSAACAALCFMIVALCQPQLILALGLVFVAFFFIVKAHRSYLFLIPVPTIAALAPTTINSIRYSNKGALRQLFMDSMVVTSQSASGSVTPVGSESVISRMVRLLGLNFSGRLPFPIRDFSSDGPLALLFSYLVAACLILMGIFAVVSLLMPITLRLSRAAWVLIVSGAALSVISSRITVSLSPTGCVYGSPLPGMTLCFLGLLMGMSMVAGRGVKVFTPLTRRVGSSGQMENTLSRHPLASAGRGLIAALLVVFSVVWSVSGYLLPSASGRLSASDSQLPLVAQEYLQANSSRRILAVQVSSGQKATYAVMRSSRGDIIDVNPSAQSQEIAALAGHKASKAIVSARQTDKKIAHSLALLMGSSSSRAIANLVDLGFGGIYVLSDSGQEASSLVTHIVASDNTQNVVETGKGTYLRFIVEDIAAQGINQTSEKYYSHTVSRYIWLVLLALILIIYCVVAFPRRSRYSLEQA